MTSVPSPAPSAGAGERQQQPDSRTPPDVAALAREACMLSAAATEGPWTTEKWAVHCEDFRICKAMRRDDADFIARARTLLPLLARAVLDREGADWHPASEQQVAEAWRDYDKARIDAEKAALAAAPPPDGLPFPADSKQRWLSVEHATRRVDAARARLTSLLSRTPTGGTSDG